MEKDENARIAKKPNREENNSDETVDIKIRITGSYRKILRDLYFLRNKIKGANA